MKILPELFKIKKRAGAFLKHFARFNALYDNRGFTLLEIMIVLVIISVLGMFIIPRMPSLMNSKRTNFLILTSVIAKTFDDSYIKERQNFLVIHLFEPMEETQEGDLYARNNGISVVNLEQNGTFADSKNKLLKYQSFPESFKLEEILLSTGERIAQGNVFVPFYPSGTSDDVIIHILVNNEERWSVRIYKMRKEPEIISDYITFEQ